MSHKNDVTIQDKTFIVIFEWALFSYALSINLIKTKRKNLETLCTDIHSELSEEPFVSNFSFFFLLLQECCGHNNVLLEIISFGC